MTITWFPTGWFPSGWFPGDAYYTRGEYLPLPSDDTDLATPYSETDYTDVATDDGTRVSQSATNQYAIHEFKNDATGKYSVDLTWDGQTNLGNTVGNPTILEIYNHTSGLWDEVDRDSSTGPNADFTLSGSISNLAVYKDVTEFISCRVYQLAQ